MTEQEEEFKCPECQGRGSIWKRVPAVAMAFPDNPEDWKWEDVKCWRCHEKGTLKRGE